jgi:hypothetical protein
MDPLLLGESGTLGLGELIPLVAGVRAATASADASS